MTPDPMTRIAVAFARSAMAHGASVCMTCKSVLDVSGAGVTVFGGGEAGPLCASDERAGALELAQFTLGDGPCREAFRSGAAVSVPSFVGPLPPGWALLGELAAASGIRAVFAFPLTVGGAPIGALTLYQDAQGPLSGAQHSDGLALSEVVAETVLSAQDAMPVGVLAPELDAAVSYRSEVYQAAGIVSVQLGISVVDALATIRARAVGTSATIEAVAAAVVARRLHFDHPPELREGI